MSSSKFAEDDLVAMVRETKKQRAERKKRKAVTPAQQVRLGIVTQVFEEEEDREEDDSDISTLKRDEIRVQWYPTGNEERLNENKPVLIDRGFRQGGIVSRYSDKHKIGTVLDVSCIGDCLLLPDQKFVIKDVDISRTEFLTKFDPFADGLFVLYEDWVGSISSVSYRLTLRSKHGYRCQIVTDNNDYITEDTSYELVEGSTFDNVQWYKGLKVQCSYVVLKNADWLPGGIPPSRLRKKIDRCSAEKTLSFLVEEVELESVKLRWEDELIYRTVNKDPSVSKKPPNRRIAKEDLSKLMILDHFQHHVAEVGDRMVGKVEASDVIVSLKEWKSNLQFLLASKDTSKKLVCEPSTPRTDEVALQTGEPDADQSTAHDSALPAKAVVDVRLVTTSSSEEHSFVTASGDDDGAAGGGDVTTTSGDVKATSGVVMAMSRDVTAVGGGLMVLPDADMDKMSTASVAGSTQAPTLSNHRHGHPHRRQHRRESTDDALVTRVAKAFAGTSAPTVASASLTAPQENLRTGSTSAALHRKKNRVAFKTRAKWLLSGRRKHRHAACASQNKAERPAAPQPHELGDNAQFVGEIILVRSYVDVLWQDGTIEKGVSSTELCHQEYDIDHQNFAMPGSFVQMKRDDGTFYPKSETDDQLYFASPAYGMIHKVDNEQRLAVVSFFANEKYLKTQEVSLFDLVEDPELGQSLQLIGELITNRCADEGVSAAATLGQTIGYSPELGQVKVRWFDGRETSEFPYKVWELSWNVAKSYWDNYECGGVGADSDTSPDQPNADDNDSDWETATSSEEDEEEEEDDWGSAHGLTASFLTRDDVGQQPPIDSAHSLYDMAAGILASLYPLEAEINAAADEISQTTAQIEKSGENVANHLKRKLTDNVSQTVDSLVFVHKLVFKSVEWQKMSENLNKLLVQFDTDIENKTDAIVEEVKQLNKESKAWMKGKPAKSAISGLKWMEIMLKIGEWLSEVKGMFVKVKSCAEQLKANELHADKDEKTQDDDGDKDKEPTDKEDASATDVAEGGVACASSAAATRGRFTQSDTAPASHRYASDAFDASAATRHFLRAVRDEIRLLHGSLPEGIHVIGYEDRLDLYSCMMVGPEGTPFVNGLYFFDLQLQPAYPNIPPLVFYRALSPEQLNPNLYQDGKVCLSLLGTWDGDDSERWNPGSNLLQVMVSIQGLILTPEPYFNEAGYEARKTLQESSAKSRRYNEMALIGNLETLIRVAHSPMVGFETEITDHLRAKGAKLIRQLETWLDDDSAGCDFPLLPISEGCKQRLRRLIQRLEKILREKRLFVQ